MHSPFHSLEAYVALPRTSGLKLSPDGKRLVTTVATLNAKGTQYRTALWQLDPSGRTPARRLTRSRKGESSAVFTDAGDILFTSARPDPEADEDEEGPAALWLLPAEGGDARLIGNRLGGFEKVASHADVLLAGAQRLSLDMAEEERVRKERKDLKVSAILHSSYPIRHWDHDLGPGSTHLLSAPLPDESAASTALDLTDLTPDATPHQVADFDLAPDGSFAILTWQAIGANGERHSSLRRLDLADGSVRTVLDDPDGADAYEPLISPDGTQALWVREPITSPTLPPHLDLNLVNLEDGTSHQVAVGWDHWAAGRAWLPDGSGIVLTADSKGRSPVFLLDLGSDTVTQVTKDDAAFTDPQVSPDGDWLYALRTSYLAPSEAVRIDLAGHRSSGEPMAAELLPNPAPAPALPGTLTEVTATAEDGAPLRGWLCLPDGADADHPAPLLLWIHGGPLNSWNAWSWRWCPWLMVAQGYAVLLPDPALSTGYGEDFIARGWARWGAAPYTDLLAITDAVEDRSDIDETRTAAMGGSFGGYMANWVAGQTDRFKAIVTHASLWALDQFGPTTDHAYYWAREVDDEMARTHSPHANVERINTPMLVVHGDRDYRVPIGEGLRLWWELLSRSRLAMDDAGLSPHRFLYFPDENHWVLSPQHAAIWYGTVNAFLSEHVLDEPKDYPELLG